MRTLPLISLLAAAPAFACGVCGCATHTDWASQGIWSGPGFRLSLRTDYFNQDQLRTGRSTVDRGSFALPADTELQTQTITRALTLGLDWSPTDTWGFNLALPYIHRTHETLAKGDVEDSASRQVGLGDVRLMARYMGLRGDRSFGVLLGVKLATGRRDETFASGPQAGAAVDRGLQLGTGSTDLLVGLTHFGEFNGPWSHFASAQLQVPLIHGEGFRPGNAFTGVLGLRRTGAGPVQPQVQLTVRTEQAESGTEADAPNSGATLVHFTPGIVAQLGARTSLSAFVQLPVYQNVRGLQLQPRALFSAALHVAF
ncbi:MAG TPA: hypothetical protein VJ623_01835 [Holophagaceae bacterium]|nr:hypothetical protein [Holophagaceae bacterium]HJW33077.1 hypothetical protein [Holophagaceae bacterium]